jgi:hypothetical protein
MRFSDYLNPNDFDKLADSLGVQLIDGGLGELGELIECITAQILKESANSNPNSKKLDIDNILFAARAFRLKAIKNSEL